MIKKIDDLIRFDFTTECRNCKYRKELSQLEYCCSFVFEQIQKNYLKDLKRHILNYIFFEDILTKIDYNNLYFTNNDEYGVLITFKTNLKQDKKLILQELKNSLNKSTYFNNIHFLKDTLYLKQDENVELIK